MLVFLHLVLWLIQIQWLVWVEWFLRRQSGCGSRHATKSIVTINLIWKVLWGRGGLDWVDYWLSAARVPVEIDSFTKVKYFILLIQIVFCLLWHPLLEREDEVVLSEAALAFGHGCHYILSLLPFLLFGLTDSSVSPSDVFLVQVHMGLSELRRDPSIRLITLLAHRIIWHGRL